jgi:glycosyltransferase involved in cell wall biosynthesis
LAAIEAAYLGLPAVVSALPGMQEIMTEGETGYTVDITDVAGYADRLGRLLTDPDLATRISVAARNKAVRDFDFDRIVEAHLRLYELSWAATPTCPADRRPDWAVR